MSNKIIPRPYLSYPFPFDSNFTYLAGWNYDQEEIAIHGVIGHGAIDFGLKYGAPVLAAAAGLALAVWDEEWLTNEDGSARLSNGRPMTFGQGLTVQIYHGNGRFTQYGHLSRLAEFETGKTIPFHASLEDSDKNLPPHPLLRGPVEPYRKRSNALPVKAGDVIGYVGVTGGAIGVRSYDEWLMGKQYETYMDPHLHFVEFRRNRTTRVAERHDPFGIYGEKGEYPALLTDWSSMAPPRHHPPLWL